MFMLKLPKMIKFLQDFLPQKDLSFKVLTVDIC